MSLVAIKHKPPSQMVVFSQSGPLGPVDLTPMCAKTVKYTTRLPTNGQTCLVAQLRLCSRRILKVSTPLTPSKNPGHSKSLDKSLGYIYRGDNHGWLFGWKNGYVFQAGPANAMNWYGTSDDGSQSGAGTRADDPDSMCGNAVLYDAVAGKILTVGGAPAYVSKSFLSAIIVTLWTSVILFGCAAYSMRPVFALSVHPRC